MRRADELFGSYLLGIENKDKKPQNAAIKIMVPKETIDFRAVEGMNEEDLRLSEKGSLLLEKEFAPGVKFSGIDFLVGASFGKTRLTLSAPYAIKELSLLVPKNSGLELSGENLKPGEPMRLNRGEFLRYVLSDMQTDQIAVLTMQGIPMGRMLYWWAGGIFATLLVLVSGMMSWLKRPKGTA